MQSGAWTITAPAPRRRAPEPDRLLTIPEVADACQLSEKAIRRAIDRGQLKAFKLCSRIRISRVDMRDWIASQRQPALSVERPRTQVAAAARQWQQQREPAPPAGSFRAMVHENARQGRTA